ncbi:MAG: 5-amino-6-(5-phosphoribosylamino)uracil reductase, partial [Polaromonas sp.]|nr:5-amino-6-(5-phosphoribosylamino)uracil reductase [Polaromonas sp.]
PHVVEVDIRLETPLDAPLLIADRARYNYCAEQNDQKKAALEARGATVICLPGPNDKVDLAAMLHDLARREINELHVEAGHKLNGSFIREGLVDELLLYMAPVLLGSGKDMASFGPLQKLSEGVGLRFLSADMVGTDLRVRARVLGRDAF